MDQEVEERMPSSRQTASAPWPKPLLDPDARALLVTRLRVRFGLWSSARDLADLARIGIEAYAGVPGGVVACRGVVYFEAKASPAERRRLIGRGVAAALLSELFVTFSRADIKPMADAIAAGALPP